MSNTILRRNSLAMIQDAKQEKYHELLYYTWAHPDPSFIHQLAVDAYAAQNASPTTKPIGVAFALIGLYLHIEKRYSGKEVQRAHILLGRRRKKWPHFALPEERGEITISEVLAAPPGPDRDQAIEKWCRSVWTAWRESQEQIRQLVKAELR
jgi:Family of unknown function (DUF5946)